MAGQLSHEITNPMTRARLDAQRRAQAGQNLADATVTSSIDLVALFKALGGGWQEGDQ
jgi:hypothetical protein